MRHGDSYIHYKGVEYFFYCIAIPATEIMFTKNTIKSGVALDAHTPDGEEVKELPLYRTKEGITVIESEYPHVIYQSKKTDLIWARKVDDFFGYKTEGTSLLKRFSYKGRK